MEEETVHQLLQRYRRDRRILLHFILSSSLIQKVVLPPGSVSLDDISLDQVSADHVVHCARKGERLELSEAIREYHDATGLPHTDNTGSNHVFFLVTDPNTSGSPPRRTPPPPPPSIPSTAPEKPVSTIHEDDPTLNDIEDLEDLEDLEDETVGEDIPVTTLLPSFSTGITEDDLRETAYELLLSCVGTPGGLLMVPSRDRRKDHKSRFMKKLGRSSSTSLGTEIEESSGLYEIMRVQMQISETMDFRTRKGLINSPAVKQGKPMDSLLIPLELLCSVPHTDFPDTKSHRKWQRRQFRILEEGLLNHPSPILLRPRQSDEQELRNLLSKAEQSGSPEHLRSLRDIAVPFSRSESTGDTCHWSDGYHLNVRLYEKLIASVFDVLDEGNLVPESGSIVDLLKSTWRVLGVSEHVHRTCYARALFDQFVSTREHRLLKLAIDQLSNKTNAPTDDGDGSAHDLAFLQPIRRWADAKLADYHRSFADDPTVMRYAVEIASVVRRRLRFDVPESVVVEAYVSSSLKTAFRRISEQSSSSLSSSSTASGHGLSVIAEKSLELLQKDVTVFNPMLGGRKEVSAALIHRMYAAKLKPFVDVAEHLTDDVRSALRAADGLERYAVGVGSSFRFPIMEKVGTMVMRWVNLQAERILGWVGRAVDQDRWIAISPQQRYGGSVIEVFRIVEETVDQFFSLGVPMGSSELAGLFRAADNALRFYAERVGNVGAADEIVPPEPPLTRHRKDAGIKAFVKKEHRQNPVSGNCFPPTHVLCIRLNTLHYASGELAKLEDAIWRRWIERSRDARAMPEAAFTTAARAVDASVGRVCDYAAAKVVYCDLKDPFIENLYRPSASERRLETLIEPLDAVLGELCGVVVEALRDRVVAGLLRACLDGFVFVVLNGGPSRVFSTGDAVLLEEDLGVLKEFFISGGDGLPRGVVEGLLPHARRVVGLLGRDTRRLIDDLKSSEANRGDDAPVLLRILCHRNDPEASHFLKKQYKLPSSTSAAPLVRL